MPGLGMEGTALKILGIETSCDDTCAGVVEDGRRLLGHVVSSQASLHSEFGGVVPELASRRHTENITPVVQAALDRSDTRLDEIDAVAVTVGPGLIGSLVVGVSFAKSLAAARTIALVGVDHLRSHFYANLLIEHDPLTDEDFPTLALIASGGHSDLILVRAHGDWEVAGSTLDDAAGEAFDKGARVLGLGYPGGPAVQEAAASCGTAREEFPVANVAGHDFSFSGVKSELSRRVSSQPGLSVSALAAGYQEAVVEALAGGLDRACEAFSPRSIALAGGVAANERLRERAREIADARQIACRIPPIELCTDNAAMTASCGYFKLQVEGPDGPDLDAYSTARYSKPESESK